MASNKEEFQMTREELHSLEKAMKDAEFRKLLVEYAEEISNPENRKKYEEEIAMMENERGMNVKFVNPKPGFVAKTHQVGDGVKVFVNICQNENIQKATATMSTRKTGTESQKGEQWSIPYSLAVGREDVDKAGDKCLVYDVVFHPDTYQKALQDARFKKLLISTALEGVEKQFNVQLDKENVKLPKLKFKGVAKSTVIRTPKSGASEAPPAPPDLDIGGIKLPYPYDNNPEETSKPKKKSSKLKIEEESGPVTPRYSIVHRGHVDMQNFTNARDSSQGTRPKELVISIDLPLLDSAANVDLDVFERQLTLESSNPAYLLDISLPYPVKEEEGAARFDKSKRQLVVTLPVIPAEVKSIDSLFSPVVEIISAENEQDTASEHDSGVSSPRSTSNMEDTSVTRDQIPEQETPETEPSVNTESENQPSSIREEEIIGADSHEEHVTLMNGEDEVSLEVTENLLNEYLSQQNFSTEDSDTVVAEDIITGFPCMYFQCPPYSYHQDIETVTFILSVSGVSLESVSLGFNTDRCYISFPGHPNPLSSTPVPDFALYVSFLDHCFLDADKCQVDVGTENVVLTLHKAEDSWRLWDGFLAGPGEDKLTQKIFLSDTCVEFVLEEIEKQDPWDAPPSNTTFDVTSMSEEQLIIEVESKTTEPVDNKPNPKVAEQLAALRTKDITMGIPPQYSDYLSKEDNRTDPSGGGGNDVQNAIIDQSKLDEKKSYVLDQNENGSGFVNGNVNVNEKKGRVIKGNEENGSDATEKEVAEVAESISNGDVLVSSNGRPFSPLRIVRMKSRSVSTDSEGGLSTDDLETESPTDEDDDASSESSSYKKQVRFNLVPEIREFNSKKKYRRKKKKNRKNKKSDNNGELSSSPSSPGTSPIDGAPCFPQVDNCLANEVEQPLATALATIKEKEEHHVVETGGKSLDESQQDCQFENSLIFELD